MCVVSNIGDGYRNTFPDRWPNIKPAIPWTPTEKTKIVLPPEVTKADIDALREEVRELKKLLIAAKKFDEATGQAECEMDAKVEFIKQIAEAVGVDMEDVFK